MFEFWLYFDIFRQWMNEGRNVYCVLMFRLKNAWFWVNEDATEKPITLTWSVNHVTILAERFEQQNFFVPVHASILRMVSLASYKLTYRVAKCNPPPKKTHILADQILPSAVYRAHFMICHENYFISFLSNNRFVTKSST